MSEFQDKQVIKGDRYDFEREISICNTSINFGVADLARSMVERWGMVAGVPDGEDSSGRAKLRLMTPEELVERACETAGLLTRKINALGWCLEVPAPKLKSEVHAAELVEKETPHLTQKPVVEIGGDEQP